MKGHKRQKTFRGIWPMPLPLLNQSALTSVAQRMRIPTSARSIGFMLLCNFAFILVRIQVCCDLYRISKNKKNKNKKSMIAGIGFAVAKFELLYAIVTGNFGCVVASELFLMHMGNSKGIFCLHLLKGEGHCIVLKTPRISLLLSLIPHSLAFKQLISHITLRCFLLSFS